MHSINITSLRFENAFALGALMAYGDDIKKTDEDDSGNTPISMCPSNCDELFAEAEGIAEEVKKRREEKKAKEESELDEDDDDDDDDDDDVSWF